MVRVGVPIVAILALLAVVFVGAVGTGAAEEEVPPAADEEGLPPADGDGAVDSGESPCFEDEPDCTVMPDDPVATDLPVPADGPAPADDGATPALISGLALTVSEALTTAADGVLAVRGHLFDYQGDDVGLRLCESLEPLGERYGCGGAFVPLEGLDLADVQADVIPFEGTTYTEMEIVVYGELVDGVLVVDTTTIGFSG
jgi:hypothetical protein